LGELTSLNTWRDLGCPRTVRFGLRSAVRKPRDNMC
jgi:hypothetical protein